MESEQVGRIALALNRALQKPQLLQYLRDQILHDFKENLRTITDEEVEQFLREHSVGKEEERKTEETR